MQAIVIRCPWGTPLLFLDDFTCCDVEPATDNACLLELPAVILAPGDVEKKFGGD
jgi:hypothetical protein